EAHLLDCEGCVNYLARVRTTIALTGRLREDDVPPGVEATLVRAFRGWHANSPG
ncbi:MAG: hypothetical protein QOD48_2106, partial [Gaiellaceae bacterium]|nr:hypothetical protein [Gaiellaceae bacterium]